MTNQLEATCDITNAVKYYSRTQINSVLKHPQSETSSDLRPPTSDNELEQLAKMWLLVHVLFNDDNSVTIQH